MLEVFRSACLPASQAIRQLKLRHVLALSAVVTISAASPTVAAAVHSVNPPNVRHVFIIVLENEDYHDTFGPKSPAAYLKKLAGQGALLPRYFAIGHFSLDNYIAMVSGQAPNPATQNDCSKFVEFVQIGMAPYGQAIGSGCVYPPGVQTIAGQLENKGLTWKAYMEDMGNNLQRDKSATCAHPVVGQSDDMQQAMVGDQYATRHNPFVYFHAIIDQPTCASHVVNLSQLAADLRSPQATPNFAFISPNLCHDGHDGGEGRTCVDGEPGGLVSADEFLAALVPQILMSPAFKKDGLLVVTFDESDVAVKTDPKTNQQSLVSDATACCGEQSGPNIDSAAKMFGGTPDQGPGILGPGGGRIGAVLLSPLITPGTVSRQAYNHYALLRSIEDIFGLDRLGYAAQDGLRSFGGDVFRKPGQ